jgi:hypothetical protein
MIRRHRRKVNKNFSGEQDKEDDAVRHVLGKHISCKEATMVMRSAAGRRMTVSTRYPS